MAAPSTPSERARELVETLRADAAETDVEGGFPERSIAALGEAGLLAAPIAAARGGEALGDAEHTLELLETLAVVGRGSLVVGRLYEGHVNALQLVERYGDEAQRARAAEDARRGHLFGVWNTEAADGVVLARDGDGRRLRGRKTFASGLGRVARAIVTARIEGADAGPQMLLLALDERAPGIDPRFWRPLGMRASASYAADFGGRRVEPGERLGAPGDYYRQPAFGGGAVRFCAVQLGGAEAIFDETRRFLRDAKRIDDPYQRMRAGEMAWRIECGRLWLRGAAERSGPAMSASASPDPQASQLALDYANLMRGAIEAQCLRVMELATATVGARGLLRPEPFERMLRDLAHYLRQPAPDAALAAVGQRVLGDPRSAETLWN